MSQKTFLLTLLIIGLVLNISIPAQAYIATFYPDADPEGTTVDGVVDHYSSGVGIAWSNLITAGGTPNYMNSNGTFASIGWRAYQPYNPDWFGLSRMIMLFDTSFLGSSANITEAVLYLYGGSKTNYAGGNPDICIVSSAPESSTNLVAGDYDSLGSTVFSNVISYSSFSTAGYNSFTLNLDGIANINTTGISNFGAREYSHDLGGVSPTNGVVIGENYSRLYVYTAEKGINYAPKLVVTYTLEGEVIPEPSSLFLLGIGVLGIAGVSVRKKR